MPGSAHVDSFARDHLPPKDLWPDLIVLCGGITEEPENFMSKLHCEARLCVGAMRSEAGIVGAALATTVASLK